MATNGVIPFQKHFQTEESDIKLISYPKSGTTWLKTITFSIVNRPRYAIENSPLFTTSPHQLIPFVELTHFRNNNQSPDLESYLSSTRRMFSTHIPYASLPTSILSCNCQIVYICRNPLDQFISEWQFISRCNNCQLDLHEAFERACNGIQSFGPFGIMYWVIGKPAKQPDKILFLKYEDLKEDVTFYIKRMADFLGCPFSEDEVTEGVVQEIAKLCSFDNIKNLEVIKTGRVKQTEIKNSLFVRKGEVGDWKNYLTPSMSQRLQKIVEEKLVGSGLTFKTSLEEPQK